MPLFTLALVTLLGATAVCIDAIRLHDMARVAARTAVTTNDPVATVSTVLAGRNVRAEVDDDPATQMVTVRVSRDVPGLGWLSRTFGLSARVTMMREAPPVLKR